MKLWDRMADRMGDRFADKLLARMEDENALPLSERLYDVVVDDPGMVGRHEFRAVRAISARAAQVEAYQRAMRLEGFRCVAIHPAGDEVTLSVAREAAVFATVHLVGQHPAVDYGRPEESHRRVDAGKLKQAADADR